MATANLKPARPPFRTAESSYNERLEPHLLRAAETDNVSRLEEIIARARAESHLHENLLYISLMRSSEKGAINATRYLLSQGVLPDGPTSGADQKTSVSGDISSAVSYGSSTTGYVGKGNRLSPLLRAVEKNHIEIVRMLLDNGADLEQGDKDGRTALMSAAWLNHSNVLNLLIDRRASLEQGDKDGRTALMAAAWKNHWGVLNLLIDRGADVNARDKKGRNVLHNLGADTNKVYDWDDSVVELLLRTEIKIDGKEAEDELGRTPLLWACATGKKRLAEMLLDREHLGTVFYGANVAAKDIRDKTALHLAAANNWDEIVRLLLRHSADVYACSDGGWTPLHNACACEDDSSKVVQILLQANSDVNAKLSTGKTPLHLAAERGHLDVVKDLLACEEIKRAERDTFGSTPFLRAAMNKRKDIVRLLAPSNMADTLSEDAKGACDGFHATIVDFGKFHNKVEKRTTVFELLYGRDCDNDHKPQVTVLPVDGATNFRWIHLPANNMAWIEVLLTKLFIEEGSSDVEGFKALEGSFNHQHRGRQSHSHFMRPLCQGQPRVTRERVDKSVIADETEQELPTVTVNGQSDGYGMSKKGSIKRATSKEKSKKGSQHRGTKSPYSVTPTSSSRELRITTDNLDNGRAFSPSINCSTPSHKDVINPNGNIFIFMPYLHFESARCRQEMQQAIKRAESRLPLIPGLVKASNYDEMLIRAHLAPSTASLHVRRTLDQSFYHNIDTETRDQNQVVYRYQVKETDSSETNLDPKIMMVDQLWMWVLGPSLIVTSFPQRWQQPKNDPLNVLDNVLEDINNKTREPVRSVYDLAMAITSRCTGVFDRHRIGNEAYQFFDMFESSIGNAMDRETELFNDFNTASEQASMWLRQHRRPNRFSRYLAGAQKEATALSQEATKPKKFKSMVGENTTEDSIHGPLFVDQLLDIGSETDLLAETKDIRDELNMITKILKDQASVLPDLSESISSILTSETSRNRSIRPPIQVQLKTIDMYLQDLARMDLQTERIYKSITDLLDLKQKHANVFEARFARDQAVGTMRQGQTIMVFTIVTIVFLPLSFIAAFMAINVSEFPHTEGNGLPLSWVAKYMFGIGFAVSIPFIAVALRLEDIVALWTHVRLSLVRKKKSELVSRDLVRREQEVLRSFQGSMVPSRNNTWDKDGLSMVLRTWTDGPASGRREMERPCESEKVPTMFRMRGSADVEQGLVTR